MHSTDILLWCEQSSLHAVAVAFLKMDSVHTAEMGACDRPAVSPVVPHVSTPPRPLVLKLEPNTASSLCFRVAVTSSRHRLEHAIVLSPWKPKAYSACASQGPAEDSGRWAMSLWLPHAMYGPEPHTPDSSQATHHLQPRNEVINAQTSGKMPCNLHSKRGRRCWPLLCKACTCCT
jgi:hypothetical protein